MESQLISLFENSVKEGKIAGIGAIALDKSGHVLFKGSWGTTNLADENAQAFDENTPVFIFSCTKLITSVAALQLVEQGKIELDDLVEKYVPSMKDIQVLEGWQTNGDPIYRPAKTKATIHHLMTHTCGFTYDFLDAETLKWRVAQNQAPASYGNGVRDVFNSPLSFDPGTQYQYGVNTDWLGFVVEAVSGMPLNEYVKKNITDPLGMLDTDPHLKTGQSSLAMHLRGEDGSLTANPDITHPANPEVYGGGSFLYSTLNDYSTFLLTLLNRGTHPSSKVRILLPESVKEYIFADHLSRLGISAAGVGEMRTAIPPLSGEGDLLPGISKSWSCGLMLNTQDNPTGRAAGSGQWCGLGNLYYWVDPVNGKLGLVMSSIFPFMDREVLTLFDELERMVYGHDSATEGEQRNFKLL
jgi:methyl acetate hydrolase